VKKTKPNYPIKVLNKSHSILEILLQQGSTVSMTEISEKLRIYPSAIHCILDTLRHWGIALIQTCKEISERLVYNTNKV